MKYKCSNCGWTGDELSKMDPFSRIRQDKCPKCGDDPLTISLKSTSVPEPTPAKPIKKKSLMDKVKENFDINNDGKVDKKDFKAMAKKLGGRGGRRSSGKRGRR